MLYFLYLLQASRSSHPVKAPVTRGQIPPVIRKSLQLKSSSEGRRHRGLGSLLLVALSSCSSPTPRRAPEDNQYLQTNPTRSFRNLGVIRGEYNFGRSTGGVMEKWFQGPFPAWSTFKLLCSRGAPVAHHGTAEGWPGQERKTLPSCSQGENKNTVQKEVSLAS